MEKVLKRVLLCAVLAAGIWGWSVVRDQQKLESTLIRLHVVANSDSLEDQAIKLRVRDAVLLSLQQAMAQVADRQEAYAYLEENLQKLQHTANEALKALGCQDHAVATLCREAFDTRVYDTFTLPAGIYDALRITIGEGEGRNWWCVAYPALCLPEVSREVEAVAVDAGLSGSLTGAITGEKPYTLRFFVLDLLGSLRGALWRP